MKRVVALALLCCACRGSGIPWRVVDAELQAEGKVTVTFKANLTGMEAEVVAEGPAKLHFDREAPTPAVPEP